MSKSETKDSINSWSFGASILALVMLAIAHCQMTRLFPAEVYQLTVFKEKIIPLSWEGRFLFRGLFIFAVAYGSMAISITFNKKQKEYGIWVFGFAAALLMIGYVPNYTWYNLFIYPFLPFILFLYAKHLPVIGFKRKRQEDHYNNYPKIDKKGGNTIKFPLQKERVKSIVDEKANFQMPLVLLEPDETTIIQAGTGKGKSRSCVSHYIESCIRNGWNVIIHDYKGNPYHEDHPELTKFALDAVQRTKQDYDLNVVGFTDALYTKRINIYDPAAVKNEQSIRSVNQALMYSLNKSWKKSQGDTFWKDNAMALVNGLTLAMREYRPRILTLPHLVAMSLTPVDHLIDAINNIPDMHIKVQFQSFINAFNMAKETAGSVISSTQIPLLALNDPVMFWTLSGTAADNDFFPLEFGKTNKPFILSVCNNDTQPIHSHGINPYLRAILSRLNSSMERPTALILDEFPRIYVDDIDAAIATVRSSGVKICIVIQTYKQLVQEFGAPYADNIMDLGQNKIYGGGSSVDSLRKFVDSYVPKYQDLEMSMNQTSNDDSSGLRTTDKKIVEVPDISGQEKFHWSGVLSTGDPNTFYNIPFKVNPLKMPDIKLPYMNKTLSSKLSEFQSMKKAGVRGEEPVTSEEAQAAYNQYVADLLEANRKKIFSEAEDFITDLRNGAIQTD